MTARPFNDTRIQFQRNLIVLHDAVKAENLPDVSGRRRAGAIRPRSEAMLGRAKAINDLAPRVHDLRTFYADLKALAVADAASEGHSYQAIADALACSVPYVEQMVYRGRRIRAAREARLVPGDRWPDESRRIEREHVTGARERTARQRTTRSVNA